jgi:hypothetical protein
MGMWFGKKRSGTGPVRSALLLAALVLASGGMAGCHLFIAPEEEVARAKASAHQAPPRAPEDPRKIYDREYKRLPDWVKDLEILSGPVSCLTSLIRGPGDRARRRLRPAAPR